MVLSGVIIMDYSSQFDYQKLGIHDIGNKEIVRVNVRVNNLELSFLLCKLRYESMELFSSNP